MLRLAAAGGLAYLQQDEPDGVEYYQGDRCYEVDVLQELWVCTRVYRAHYKIHTDKYVKTNNQHYVLTSYQRTINFTTFY